MTQADWLVLVLKVALVSGFASLVGWVAVYHVLSRGGWRRNPIGRTLVAKTVLIAGLFVPTALSLFFRLSRSDSLIAGWVDAALIALVTPVMCWRICVWIRLHKAGRLPRNGHDGLTESIHGTGRPVRYRRVPQARPVASRLARRGVHVLGARR